MHVVAVVARGSDVLDGLRLAGASVSLAATPESAEALARSAPAHAVVLDERLAPGHPADVVAALRVGGARLLVLAGVAGPEHAVEWLDAGADDVVPPAAGAREVTARVAALVRRAGSGSSAPRRTAHRVGDLVVELDGRAVRLAGRRVPLPAAQFAVLLALAEAAPEPVPLHALRSRLWGDPAAGQANAVRVHVRRLRRALEDDPQHPERLVTVPGSGYAVREVRATRRRSATGR